MSQMFNPLRYYELHEHLANEHGLVLVESQLEEIILICKKLEREVNKQKLEIDVPDGYALTKAEHGDLVVFQGGAELFYRIQFETISSDSEEK